MSYNGLGGFSINSAGQPVISGTVITSTAFNLLTADLATGLSTAICKDGQTTTTQLIPFALGAGFGATSYANGTANFICGLTANFNNMDNTGGQIGATRGFYTKDNAGLDWSGGTYIKGFDAGSIDVKCNTNGVTLLNGAASWAALSDYRAKKIKGPFTESGKIIDAVPVHVAAYNTSDIFRPMFLAHEVAEGGAGFAVHGEKDAVNGDGDAMLQYLQSTDPLVPIMWAEIQSLRARLAAAGI